MHLTMGEIRNLLKDWHYYKAYITSSNSENELIGKLNAIEKAVASLDEISRKAIELHYFKCATIEITAAHVYMTVRGTYYRIASAIKKVAYLIENTA